MPMPPDQIIALIRAALPDAEVSLDDLAGDGDHYAAHVISPSFRGLSRIQQHRMVFAALQGKAGTELHALAIHTAVPKA